MSPANAALGWLSRRCATLQEFRVDPEGLREFAARRAAAGRRIADTALATALDPATYAEVRLAAAEPRRFAHGLELCAAVAGFGAVLGEAVLQTLHAAPDATAPGVEWAALWNLLVAYFDTVCDEYGVLQPALLQRISPAGLDAALDPARAAGFAANADDALLLRFVVQIADETMRRLRAHMPAMPAQTSAALRQAIARAYRSEAFTASLRFSRGGDLAVVAAHLRDSASLPVWILGRASAALAGAGNLPPALDAALHHAGDFMWLADDLVDMEDDVGTDRWNAVYLVAAERHGTAALAMLEGMPVADRLAWLEARDLAQGLAERVFEAAHRLVACLREARADAHLCGVLAAVLGTLAHPAR